MVLQQPEDGLPWICRRNGRWGCNKLQLVGALELFSWQASLSGRQWHDVDLVQESLDTSAFHRPRCECLPRAWIEATFLLLQVWHLPVTVFSQAEDDASLIFQVPDELSRQFNP